MTARLHGLLLRVFAVLPQRARNGIIRIVSPTFTAGTAVVLVAESGDVLLVTQPYTKGWGLPGGLMARGETPGQTARREIAEELGLDTGELPEPPLAVKAPWRRSHLDLVFVVPVSAEAALAIRPSSAEITDARWFSPDSLPDLVEGTDAILHTVGHGPRPEAPTQPGTIGTEGA